MKTPFLFTLSALALTAIAQADLVMIQETTVGEVKSRSTMRVSGDKVRSDNGTENSSIIDTKTGSMTTLMHEAKMVIKVDMEQLKAASAGAPTATEDVKIPVSTITPTGKKEKIDGYDCEEYIMENSGTKVGMWITKDYPGYEKLKKELLALTKMNPSSVKQPELPGMAIQTEYTTNGLKFVTKIVSLKEEKVDPSVFEVPAGYKAPGE